MDEDRQGRAETGLLGSLGAALLCGGLLIAAARPTGAAAPQDPAHSQQPIIVNSASANIDYRTNTAEFTDIVVSQGNLRLRAERASAKGGRFTDTRWTFTGRVVIVFQSRGTLCANRADVQFRGGHLSQADAVGSPAHFRGWRPDSQPPAHGHADRITYDPKQQTVHFYGHVQVWDGSDLEMSAPAVAYNLIDHRLQADSRGETQRVEATLLPKSTLAPGVRGSGHGPHVCGTSS